MKIRNFFLGAIGVALTLTSCSPVYYPPQANVPLLTEKGEGKVNVGFDTRSLNVQGSYAVTDNFALAVSGNGFRVKSTTVDNLSTDSIETYGGSRGYQLDIMPGYYQRFADIGIFEIYGGYGLGSINSDQVDGLVHKLIIQPSIGYASGITEGAFTIRMVQVSADKAAIVNSSITSLSTLFFEPTITFKIGSENLKFTTNLGLSIPSYGSALSTEPLESQPFVFNVGAQYRFGGKKKK